LVSAQLRLVAYFVISSRWFRAISIDMQKWNKMESRDLICLSIFSRGLFGLGEFVFRIDGWF